MIEYRKELFEMELLNIQQIEKYYGNKSSLTKAISICMNTDLIWG